MKTESLHKVHVYTKYVTCLLVLLNLFFQPLSVFAQDRAAVNLDNIFSEFPEKMHLLSEQDGSYVIYNPLCCHDLPVIDFTKVKGNAREYYLNASGEGVSGTIEKIEVTDTRITIHGINLQKEPEVFVFTKTENPHQYILSPCSLFSQDTLWIDERYKSEVKEIPEPSCPPLADGAC